MDAARPPLPRPGHGSSAPAGGLVPDAVGPGPASPSIRRSLRPGAGLVGSAAGLAVGLVIALTGYGALAWRAVKTEQIARMQTVLEIAQRATDN